MITVREQIDYSTFYGLSADVALNKHIPNKHGYLCGRYVQNGDELIIMDTGDRYLFDEANKTWLEFSVSNTGGGSVDSYTKKESDERYYTKEHLDKYLKVSEKYKYPIYYGPTTSDNRLSVDNVKTTLTKMENFPRSSEQSFIAPAGTHSYDILVSQKDNSDYDIYDNNEIISLEFNLSDIEIDGVLYGYLHLQLVSPLTEEHTVKFNLW